MGTFMGIRIRFISMIFGLTVLFISMMAITNPISVSPHQDATMSGYYLPYPGLLPDSPLYKLKAIRDRVGLWVTMDKEMKARKELAYADKRINAAQALMDGGKSELAISTATKAEKYLESSINRVQDLTDKGKDVKSLVLLLTNASAKHEEIIRSMNDKLELSGNNLLQQTLATAALSHERADQLMRDSF